MLIDVAMNVHVELVEEPFESTDETREQEQIPMQSYQKKPSTVT